MLENTIAQYVVAFLVVAILLFSLYEVIVKSRAMVKKPDDRTFQIIVDIRIFSLLLSGAMAILFAYMSWYALDRVSEMRFYSENKAYFEGKLSSERLAKLIAYNETADGFGCAHVKKLDDERPVVVYVKGDFEPRKICGISHRHLVEGRLFPFTEELSHSPEDQGDYAVRVGHWPFSQTLIIKRDAI